MDEVYIVMIRGERRYLWRAVDQDGDVLDILVQKRKNKQAAVRFFKKLMKGQGRSARLIVTDKIRERRNGRCDGSSHLARRNVSWPFTARSTISFASVGISFGLPTIGC